MSTLQEEQAMRLEDEAKRQGHVFGSGSNLLASALQAGARALRREAALLAVPSTAWQPIETAPKDGTEILIGQFFTAAHDLYLVSAFEDGDWCLPDFWRMEPTHWMPLPAVPSTAQDEAQKTDHGGTSLTEGDTVSVSVPTPQLSHVYVVETGCYENRGVAGVYTSLEAAMEAHPIPSDYQYPAAPSAANLSRPTGWHQPQYPVGTVGHGDTTRWSNGLDWDYAAEITKYELEVGSHGKQSVSDSEPVGTERSAKD